MDELKELIKSYNISTFEGRVKFKDITEKGEDVLRKMGCKIKRKRKGGPEHEYWKHRIAECFKSKGYVVEIEKPIGGGRSVDIVATENSKNIAVEIETGKSDAYENIMKDLNEGFSKIIAVPLNAKSKSKISMRKKELPRCESHKIEVLILGICLRFSGKILP